MKLSRTVVFLILLLAPLQAVDYNPIDIPNPGRIEGIVHFTGETPPPSMFANSGDHDCPHGIAQNHLMVRQQNLGLQNAIVILDIKVGRPVVRQRVSLSTERCTLTPRIQAVSKGTTLDMKNKDGAKHEIQALSLDVNEFTVPLPAAGDGVRRPLVHAGLLKINCTKHLWERAWIYVSESPYVAVTDANGYYSLENVPPGRYKLRVWHEGWGGGKSKDGTGRPTYHPREEEIEVRVRENETTKANFDELVGTFAAN